MDVVAMASGLAVIFQSSVRVDSASVKTSFSMGNSPSAILMLSLRPSTAIVPYPKAEEKKHWNGVAFNFGAK